MQINEAIKDIREKLGIKQITLAKAVGKEKATSVSSQLSKSNLTFETANKYLEAMGYEIIVRPAKQGRRADDEYKIDNIPSNG